MSVKRYTWAYGDVVDAKDYDAKCAEVERLTGSTQYFQKSAEHFRAEVERLRAEIKFLGGELQEAGYDGL